MLEKFKVKFIMLLFPQKKVTPLPKKNLLTTEKVTTSEEDDKGTRMLDYMKEAVVAIRRKYFDHFEGQYKGLIGRFNLDCGFLKNIFLHLNRTSKNIYEKDIEG